jgi:hypothetical protein
MTLTDQFQNLGVREGGVLLDGDSLRTGKVLDAHCHLVETATMWTVVHEKLKEKPLFFVERADR